MKLSHQTELFVMHFGEMGSRWGFNRTVGQMLALLVIHPEPLNADDIGSALKISRGNVSMGLKELQSWRLIQLQHLPGDRKDYFTTSGDILDMARTVFEERRKRELDPTLSMLRSALLIESDSEVDSYGRERMQEIHDLLELMTQWMDTVSHLSNDNLFTLMKMGSGVTKLLDFKDKILPSGKS